MNWYKLISDYYKAGYYDASQVKVFVVKNKISAEQYKAITGEEYTA